MGSRPSKQSRIVFEAGDRAPDFVLPDVLGHPVGLYLSATGNPIVLVFCSGPMERLLGPFAEAVDRLADAIVIFVTRLSPVENRTLAESVRLPFPILSDQIGEISTAFQLDGRQAARPRPLTTFVLDPNQRIRRVERGGDARRQVENAVREMSEMLPRPEPLPAPRPAPLLYIPKVLDGAFCRELIQHWEREGSVRTGTIDVFSSDRETLDDKVKIRRDHYIRDQGLTARLVDLVGRRIVPEIEKAFGFRATGIEELKIVCYDGESGGFFRPHRDNLSERTQHRRFAMSLLLNDPGEYDGGALRFLEYGPELYRPGAGDAVVFGCPLLHEVLPVTEGRRFVLLCFMFGEVEARQLAARKKQRKT